MSDRIVDAVVIGAGHHGLVAAALLADQGWDVVVHERRDKPGGAVASRTIDGFIVDEFSSYHPLGKASPVLQELDLERHGLSWVDHRPAVVHVADAEDGEGSPVLATPEETAAVLDADHAGDGDAWMSLVAGWMRIKEPLLDALLHGWPPVRAGAQLVRRLGAAGLLDFARFGLLSSQQLGDERFGGTRGPDILAGNAAHADVSPLAPVSGFMGYLMAMLAQDVGFPQPRGGSGVLAEALAARARHAGARVELNSPVTGITVSGRRVDGVRLADGTTVRARRAVIADVSGPALYQRLLPRDAVPAGLIARIERFAWDPSTVKLNLLLSGPMPWLASRARDASVVHAGLSHQKFPRWHTDIVTGRVPEHAFCLVGQTTTSDPSRSPSGTESLWAYTHLPRLDADASAEATKQSVTTIEAMFDALAPGWRDLEQGRWLQSPNSLQEDDPNLARGAVDDGTAQLFQQGPWRPVPGLGGPITHLEGLYLASATTHPGGGVHGGAGYNAARAALRGAGWTRPLGRATSKAQLLLQRSLPQF